MKYNEVIGEWLDYRQGRKKLTMSWKGLYYTKGLELNKNSEAFLESFGNTNILGYVGFLDIVGFSSKTKGKNPEEFEEYLTPYFSKVIDLCCDNNCLVDKTIGDEVMFILPELAFDRGTPANAYINRVTTGLLEICNECSENYSARLGLSFGEIRISKIAGTKFEEWTSIGECVNLAKRLHKYTSIEDNFSGAYGVLKSLNESKKFFEVGLAYFTVPFGKLVSEVIESPDELKGISPYYCAKIYEKKLVQNNA